ncbi:MAG: hypothetical protein DHS20C19_01910 [Acidimicrobiales bacterium]|nr:MAG: hypothetical protein DHS20C19_01910 [Acidimicrobiales bacterium]
MSPSATPPVFSHGTTEVAVPARRVSAGPLSANIDRGALRHITFDGIEVVRQIDFPIRDHNWATLDPVVTSEHLHESAAGFSYERHLEVEGGALIVRLRYDAGSDGGLSARAEISAERDFRTNRTSFTVLHPPELAIGRSVRSTAPDGTTQEVVLSEHISPSQPLKNIAGLGFTSGDLCVDISFDGEVFEMEDQRNWSDASFKTYGRPLGEPFPYVLSAGTALEQAVRLTIRSTAAACSSTPGTSNDSTTSAVAATVDVGVESVGSLPSVLLGGEAHWLPSPAQAALLERTRFDALLLRVTPQECGPLLAEARPALDACDGSLNLEIVLADDEPFDAQLRSVADACMAAGADPTHVIALPRAYLASHQPEGPWPTGPGPEVATAAARRAFPHARIGSGMLTNFTELNRCRHPDADSDFFTHGNSAIVHAADDLSVVETLDTLPAIFATARAIHGARPYRLGLTAIGMRTNPHGGEVSGNPRQKRITMAKWDPRARALFGAGWAVGALAATTGFDIEAIALAAPIGPFGVLSSPGRIERAWYDDHPEAVVHPIFHVLRALGAHTADVNEVHGLPDGVVGLALSRPDDPIRVIIANLSQSSHRIRIETAVRATSLDTRAFATAAGDPDWVETSLAPLAQPDLVLARTAVLFLDLERS